MTKATCRPVFKTKKLSPCRRVTPGKMHTSHDHPCMLVLTGGRLSTPGVGCLVAETLRTINCDGIKVRPGFLFLDCRRGGTVTECHERLAFTAGIRVVTDRIQSGSKHGCVHAIVSKTLSFVLFQTKMEPRSFQIKNGPSCVLRAQKLIDNKRQCIKSDDFLD